MLPSDYEGICTVPLAFTVRMVWTLADATRALASQLHIANGSTHCVPTDFARRNAVWRSDLRAALDTTPADAVTDAFVPCAGADVLSPLAAYPNARRIFLASLEPPLPPAHTADEALRAWQRDFERLAPRLRSVFACAHGGGYFNGAQVRRFARNWGTVPLLLAALGSAGRAVASLVADASPLPRVTLGVDGGLTVVAVQANLFAASNLSSLRGEFDVGSTCRGVLVKGAENCFRNGDADVKAGQSALAALITGVSDVVLQDTQTGLHWDDVRRWADRAVPLGAFVPAALEDVEAAAENDALRKLWSDGVARGGWRSLRGVRFGYGHGERDRAGDPTRPFEHRVPPTAVEPAAAGEADRDERGQSFACAAVLAWRAGRCGRRWHRSGVPISSLS